MRPLAVGGRNKSGGSLDIYHLSAKPISRSSGRSSTAAAAYRAGCEIVDRRTGQVHDYSRKRGVLHAELFLPGGGTADRAEFWNQIEAHHKRGDAVVAREIEVALLGKLTAEQRRELATSYARELADRYGVAVDVALHAPRTVTKRDLERNPDQHWEIDPQTGRRHNGNWHAHIMLSACHVQPDGTLGKKAVKLDPIHCQRAKIENLADRERARWAELTNAALERAGQTARVDHRSHAERGLDVEPGRHLGPAATGYERRTGEPSWLRQVREAEAAQARLEAAARASKEAAPVVAQVIDLETQLRAAVAERDRREGVMLDAFGKWRDYLGDRPESAQVIAAAVQVRARTPGAIEQAEELARGLSAGEKAAQARAEAERQATEHRAKLDAEAAQKRAQEAAMLASLRTPSPAPRSGLADQLEAYTAARRQERAQNAETRAPEGLGGDQWHEYERDGERYRHPEGRPQEVYWQNPSGEWHRQPDEPQQLDQDRDLEFDR